LAALIAIKRLPNLYESHALIVVSGMRNEEWRQAAALEMTLVTKQLESRTILEPLIKRHGLYPGLPDDARVGRMIKSLKLETKLRNYYPELPEAVAISFRHTDPAVAQRVLSDVVALFTRTNETVSKQAEEEAREVESKVAHLENQLRKFGSRGLRGPYDLGMVRAERRAAASTVEALEDRQYALDRQILDQKRLIAEQQKLVKAAPPTSFSGAYGTLLVRKAELEAQLKDYATQYTEKNPKVVQSRNQIAEINRQLAQLSATSETQVAGTPEGRELRSLEREMRRLETEMEVTQRELRRRKQTLATLPSFSEWASVGSGGGTGGMTGGLAEIGFLQSRYVSLLDWLDRMQLALASPIERGLAPFRVVDPPNLPQLPIGPDRQKLALIALCLALAIGLAAAVAVEGPRLQLIQNQRDAEFYLGAPVVALIPETLTPVERGHRRRMLMTRRLALIALAIAAVPVLAALLLQLEIIHMIAFR
jgi:uncharacterized protein involved in exopolysaccharide biosynthesis